MLTTSENQNDDELAKEVQQITGTQSEESLYGVLCHALYNGGLEVAPLDYFEPVMAIASIKSKQKINFIKTLDFVGSAVPLAESEAKKQGKSFFQRIKKEICTKIREFFTGGNTLREYLQTLIPIILGIISSSLALGPIGLAIAVAILALLIKVGYQAYCRI
jgi:hypothetical protein